METDDAPEAETGAKSTGDKEKTKSVPADRIRLRFEKRGALKFISHHDLMRTFELALRRADLNVAHTQGFNPRPKLSFAIALPLGVESLDEILDIDIEPVPRLIPEQLVEKLRPQMPAGIVLREAWRAVGRPRVLACQYQVELELEPARLIEVGSRLAEFLHGGALMHSRSRGRGKTARTLDVRAFTQAASLDASTLTMTLAFTPQGGMKPTDLLEILGIDPLAQRVIKTRTLFEEDPLADTVPAPLP